MEPDNKRPNAALINREWYLAAKGILSRPQLGSLLVKAVEYVLSGGDGVVYDTWVETAFAMVRPALDSDIAKYLERCARNAANAKSQRQRVEASGSDSQRVEANTTTTTTSTPTTTTTTTPSLSPVEVEQREKWIVFGYFWSVGSNAPEQELLAFWSYYEALGWKNNKGAAIISKLAAARMWRRQFDTKTPPDGAPVWFNVMKECEICDYSLFTGFLGAERTPAGVIVRLRCKEDWLQAFKAKCGHLLTTLAKSWRAPEIILQMAP